MTLSAPGVVLPGIIRKSNGLKLTEIRLLVLLNGSSGRHGGDGDDGDDVVLVVLAGRCCSFLVGVGDR